VSDKAKQSLKLVALAVVGLTICYIIGVVGYRVGRNARGKTIEEAGEVRSGLIAMLVLPTAGIAHLLLESSWPQRRQLSFAKMD
jgi:hypothetical protein